MNKKYLAFLSLICSACPAGEEDAKSLEEYVKKGYVLETIKETENIIQSEIKKFWPQKAWIT